jgi:hypothetical protein
MPLTPLTALIFAFGSAFTSGLPRLLPGPTHVPLAFSPGCAIPGLDLGCGTGTDHENLFKHVRRSGPLSRPPRYPSVLDRIVIALWRAAARSATVGVTALLAGRRHDLTISFARQPLATEIGEAPRITSSAA